MTGRADSFTLIHRNNLLRNFNPEDGDSIKIIRPFQARDDYEFKKRAWGTSIKGGKVKAKLFGLNPRKAKEIVQFINDGNLTDEWKNNGWISEGIEVEYSRSGNYKLTFNSVTSDINKPRTVKVPSAFYNDINIRNIEVKASNGDIKFTQPIDIGKKFNEFATFNARSLSGYINNDHEGETFKIGIYEFLRSELEDLGNIDSTGIGDLPEIAIRASGGSWLLSRPASAVTLYNSKEKVRLDIEPGVTIDKLKLDKNASLFNHSLNFKNLNQLDIVTGALKPGQSRLLLEDGFANYDESKIFVDNTRIIDGKFIVNNEEFFLSTQENMLDLIGKNSNAEAMYILNLTPDI